MQRRSPVPDESWKEKSFASVPQERRAKMRRRAPAPEPEETMKTRKPTRRYPRREAITEAVTEYRGHSRTKEDKAKTKDAIVLIAEAKREGRPPEYSELFCDLAFKMMLLGVTKDDLANLLEVNRLTLDNWCNEHPEFFSAVTRGGTIADAQTVYSLYKSANGFEREHVKIFQYEGEPVYAPYTEYYPPNPGAGMNFIKNRRPDLWRDKSEDTGSGMRAAFEMGAAIGEIRRTIIDARYEDITPTDQLQAAGRVPGPEDAKGVQTPHIARSEV